MTDLASLDLKTLEAVIARLSVEDRAELERLAAPELSKPFIPNPGAQTEAMFSEADILLAGGRAGGGKSGLLIGAAVLDHHDSIIFRREATQLDGLIKFGTEVFNHIPNSTYNGTEKLWKWEGKTLKLAGLPQPDDWRKHAGNARDFIGFDEGGEFVKEQVFSLLGWLRTTRPNQRTRCIIASNPPRGADGQWMLEEFAPWLDPIYPNPAKPGELRWAIVVGGITEWVDGPGAYERNGETYQALSRTFIPASLDENPYLRDTNYRAQLQSLPEPLRSQLLHGDFLAGRIDDEWQVIPSAWIAAAQARWPGEPKGPMRAIGNDVAQGGPDNSIIAPLHENNHFASLRKYEGKDTPNGATMAGLVMKERRDQAVVGVDTTGGWGGSTVEHLQTHNDVAVVKVVFSATGEGIDKKTGLAYANLRAKMYWEFRNALDPESEEDVILPPDKRLAAQLAAALWRPQAGKIQIESKEAIKARLGVSPDDADAVVIAWYLRHRYLKAQKAKKLTPPKAPANRGARGWMGR